MLLAGAPDPSPTGDLLDIGCGWGPIALTLALRSPDARVWGVDVNRRSLDLARAQRRRRRASTTITFCEPDEVPDDLRFATIWSNPPIHVGKAALHALLERWLPRLADDGVAHLVVQKHLGSDSLQKWVNEQDWGLTVHAPVVRQGVPHPRGPPQLTCVEADPPRSARAITSTHLRLHGSRCSAALRREPSPRLTCALTGRGTPPRSGAR